MEAGRVGLEIGGARVEIDPAAGGRVVSLRLGGVEVLSGSDQDPDNFGSTFWTSPQADWGWPPPVIIDRGQYLAVEPPARPGPAAPGGVDGGAALAFVSEADDLLGVRVVKEIAVDPLKRAFRLDYAIHNLSRATKRFAPWEVTRVRSRGLTVFPSGPPASGTLALDERPDASWYLHDPSVLPAAGKKAFVAGPGKFLGHVARGIAYIKRFAPVSPAEQAPGETPIEIYACPKYVELEVQGPYRPIEPGDSLRWSVTWILRELPDGLDVSIGSRDLFSFVAGVGAE
jgi:hypothetical protein